MLCTTQCGGGTLYERIVIIIQKRLTWMITPNNGHAFASSFFFFAAATALSFYNYFKCLSSFQNLHLNINQKIVSWQAQGSKECERARAHICRWGEQQQRQIFYIIYCSYLEKLNLMFWSDTAACRGRISFTVFTSIVKDTTNRLSVLSCTHCSQLRVTRGKNEKQR